MDHPRESDYTITRKDGGVHVLFAPTETHCDFRFLADADDIARFGPLGLDALVRHAKTGDAGKYSEREIVSVARRLAEQAARGDSPTVNITRPCVTLRSENYRDFIVSWEEPPIFGRWSCNVASDLPRLLAMMGRNGSQVIEGRDRDDMLATARRYIDGLLG